MNQGSGKEESLCVSTCVCLCSTVQFFTSVRHLNYVINKPVLYRGVITQQMSSSLAVLLISLLLLLSSLSFLVCVLLLPTWDPDDSSPLYFVFWPAHPPAPVSPPTLELTVSLYSFCILYNNEVIITNPF